MNSFLFSQYLSTMKLRNSDVLDIFRSVQYLPLNKFQFLRVHNFIQMIEASFKSIRHCIFLYNEQLIWSGINPSDLYSIYEYLTGTLFPKTWQMELQGGSMTRSFSSSFDGTSSHYGQYLIGPDAVAEHWKKPPKLYIFNEGKCETYYMIVYSALSATLCLFVEGKWS